MSVIRQLSERLGLSSHAKPAPAPLALAPVNAAANDDAIPTKQPVPSGPALTAATASPEWRQSRDEYMSHLMACRACYAPTGRYCAAGAKLRTQYDRTPMEPNQ